MNYPEEAILFLDVFVGLFANADRSVWFEDPEDIKTLKLPYIHVYGYTDKLEEEEAQEDFVERIGISMKYP